MCVSLLGRSYDRRPTTGFIAELVIETQAGPMPPDITAWTQILRPRRHLWWAILLVALLARLGFLFFVAHPELQSGSFAFPDGSDEADYHHLASQLADRGVYALTPDGPATAKRTPGLPLALALLYTLFGSKPLVAVAWVVLCSMGVVVVAGALARNLCGESPVVALAMTGAALLPTLVFTSAGIWSEPPTLLFSLLALLFYQRADGTGGKWLAAAGFCFALAYLHRPSVGPVIALIGLHVVLTSWQARRFRPVLIFSLVTALPILSWGFRNHLMFGQLMVGNTESTAALWGANNPVTAGLQPPTPASTGGFDLRHEAATGAYHGSWVPLTYLDSQAPTGLEELERKRWYSQKVGEFVTGHPKAFLRLLFYKIKRIATAEPMAPSILGETPAKRRLKWAVALGERWVLLIFGGWGLLLLARDRHPYLLSYGLFLLGSLSVVVIAYVNARIFLSVSGGLLIPAALAVNELQRSMARGIPSFRQPKPTGAIK